MSTETVPTNGNTLGELLAGTPFKELDRAEKIARALAKHSKGWTTPEEFGAAVEDYIAAGLHLVLTYPANWPNSNKAKAPIAAEDCLTDEQRTSDRWRDLNAVHLATNDAAELAAMVQTFIETATNRYGTAGFPNLGVHTGKSGLVVADADTPDTVKALVRALRTGDPDERAQFGISPTVRTPGKIDQQGNQVHKDGGHWYFVTTDDTIPNGDVDIPGTTEKWSVITGNKMVLLPGSRRTEGIYQAADNPHVGVAGPWLASAQRGASTATPTGPKPSGTASYTSSSTEERPLHRWTAAHTWHDILTAQGWTPKGTSSCGDDCRVWEHPTASSGRSATAHGTGCTEFDADPHSGSYPLHMWSGSHPQIASDTTINKAQFVCTTVYGDNWAQFFKSEDVDSYGQDILDADIAGAVARFAHLHTSPEATPSAGVAERRAPSAASTATMSEGDFWSARPVLAHIQQFARSRRVSPWAVLGNVLVKTIHHVPPNWVIPPTTGGDASLNLYVALVGNSGTGKGASSTVAGNAIDFGDVFEAPVGSGEGIAKLFGRNEPARSGKPAFMVRTHDAAVMTAPEIGIIAGITKRSGSTLLPELCKGFSGEALGRSNVSDDHTLVIAAHTYRLGAVVGVQPTKADVLFDDADGGTPQRFLWLPTDDADAPDVRPKEPGRLGNPIHPSVRATGVLASMPGSPATRRRIVLPSVVTTVTDKARLAVLRGKTSGLDGHSILTRTKVMCALAFLDGRTDPTEQDWELAGAVMAKSDSTRTACEKAIRDKQNAENVHRARNDAVRAIATDELKADRSLKRTAANVVRKLDGGDWHPWSVIRKSLRSDERRLFEDAVGSLVVAGRVEVEDTPAGGGKRMRLAPTK